MIPDASLSRTWDLPTAAERHAVLKERLKVLDDATCLVTGDGPLPVSWRAGWRCSVRVVGRSQDSSLCVELTATGPGLRTPYLRRVRLMKREALIRSLR